MKYPFGLFEIGADGQGRRGNSQRIIFSPDLGARLSRDAINHRSAMDELDRVGRDNFFFMEVSGVEA